MEGLGELNYTNSGYITTEFDTVVIMGEEFEINMFEVSHLTPKSTTSPLPPSAAGHFVTQK